MRLFHERESGATGGLDSRDEEECFGAGGRVVGVFLTTEVLDGPNTFSAEVDFSVIEAYEVTDGDAADRSFVVPGSLVASLHFDRSDG